MGKVVKSARGVVVDFDLVKIQQMLASAPKPTRVQAREDFIDQKQRRRLKKLRSDAVKQVQDTQSADPSFITQPTETPTPDTE